MKKLLVPLFVLVVCCVVFARTKNYNLTQPPRLALGAAYDKALGALGKATNRFHCVSAELAIAHSTDGEWFFTFYATNGIIKYVTVEFDGKTDFDDAPLARF